LSFPRHYWLLSTEIQPLISTSVNLFVSFSTINILLLLISSSPCKFIQPSQTKPKLKKT
ncbi:unnamed protein product, partial [Brassica rapa subsp. trilocularis]